MRQTKGSVGSLYGEASESDRRKTDEMPLTPQHRERKTIVVPPLIIIVSSIIVVIGLIVFSCYLIMNNNITVGIPVLSSTITGLFGFLGGLGLGRRQNTEDF